MLGCPDQVRFAPKERTIGDGGCDVMHRRERCPFDNLVGACEQRLARIRFFAMRRLAPDKHIRIPFD